MKVKELKDLLAVLSNEEYNDYEIVFWDYARQKRMDGHFGGLSHPDKEISIPIADVGGTYFPRIPVDGLPDVLPSPYEEGKNAYLKVDEHYVMNDVEFTRYFYECESTGKQFGTTLSETFTMGSYYCNECKKLRETLREKSRATRDIWDKIQKGLIESENDT